MSTWRTYVLPSRWSIRWLPATRWLEEIPLQEKQLKRWVREQGFTALTIKKRGVDIVPEQLRVRLLGSAGSKPSKKKQKKER